MTKFYEFDQNNSGGYFVEDDKLCHRLFIEATTLEEAIDKVEGLGVYFNGCEDGIDCSCCGDRWYEPWGDDGLTFPYTYSEAKTFQTIEEFAQYLAAKYGWTKPDARIFYKDGRVVEIFM